MVSHSPHTCQSQSWAYCKKKSVRLGFELRNLQPRACLVQSAVCLCRVLSVEIGASEKCLKAQHSLALPRGRVGEF